MVLDAGAFALLKPVVAFQQEQLRFGEFCETVRKGEARIGDRHGYQRPAKPALHIGDAPVSQVPATLANGKAVAQEVFGFAGAGGDFGDGRSGFGLRGTLRPRPLSQQTGEAGGETEHALIFGGATGATARKGFAVERLGFGVFALTVKILRQFVDWPHQCRRVVSRKLASDREGLTAERLGFRELALALQHGGEVA